MIKKHWKLILFFLFSVTGYFFIGHGFIRSDFGLELLAFGICFVSYFVFNLKIKGSLTQLFFIGLLFRLVFVWGEPRLSDDYYRFIWDAKLVVEGVSPYEELPTEFIPDLLFPANNKLNLVLQMNSPGYYSVYPPLQQLFFLPAGFADSLPKSILILRMIILIGEILLFYFLMKSVQLSGLSWIWLNPLWIIEVNGNLHFEGWMLTFVAGGIYLLRKNKNLLSALLFSLAAGLKLVPLLILPMIKKWKGMKNAIFISVVAFVLFIIPFILFIYPYQDNFFQSIDLYYHKFEFNASFYFLLKWLGFQFSDLHPIVYASQILITIFLLVYAYLFFSKDGKKEPSFLLNITIAFSVYYLLATTVHPWYILTVLFFSVLSGKVFGIVWSGLVFLSYAAYANDETLYYSMVALEYSVLFVFMYMEFKSKLRFTQPT